LKESDSEFDRWVEIALHALSSIPPPLAEARKRVPRSAGLYAISAPGAVWNELGLGDPPDSRPLYVGKSESNLFTRDIEQAFGVEPTTGWSSPRRSFAALLHDTLKLRGVPRTPRNPGHFDRFGLADDGDKKLGDKKLGDWMTSQLLLAVWPRPDSCPFKLVDLERAIIKLLQPPLNLTNVSHHWKEEIKRKRKVLADEARRAANG
jgi:hypothetical protein